MNYNNYKNKYILSCIVSLILLMSIFFAPTNYVYANIDNLGVNKTLMTQEQILNFDGIDLSTHSRTFNLYDANPELTKLYYTVKLTNGSKIELPKTMIGKVSYANESIYVYGDLCSSVSKRNPYVSVMFQISDYLLDIARTGNLSITLSAQINTTDDECSVRFSNGDIGSSKEVLNNVDNINTQNIIGLSTDNTYKNISLKIDNPTKKGFLVQFANEFKANKNELYIKQPKIIVSTKDNVAPQITNSINDANWAKGKKIVNFCVDDNKGAGVDLDTAKINNVPTKNFKKSGNQYIFSHEVDDNTDINFEIADKIGNIAKNTFLGKNIKLDNVDVPVLNIVMPSGNSSNSKNFIFSTTYIPDGLSPESIHYTMGLDKNIPDPTIDSPLLNNGENTIVVEHNGSYYLKIILVDEVGHCSGVYSNQIRIDDARYLIDVSVLNGTCEVLGASMLGDETAYHAWFGNEVTIKYNPNENYEFYKLYRNGNPEYVANNIYTFTCMGDINIQILYRFKMQMLESVTEYNYNKGNEISLDYTFNNNEVKDINFVITKDTEIVSSIVDAGEYNIKWSIDNESYIGNGEYIVKVKPIEYVLDYGVIDQFVYNGDIQKLAYTPIDGQVVETIFYQNGQIVDFKNAGKYTVVANIVDTNYLITNNTIELSIQQKNINVHVSKTEFDYTSKEQNIEYSVDDNIPSTVIYKFLGENALFKDANQYTFEVLPIDNVNYVFNNNTGECLIKKVNLNFVLNRTIYDYTGAIQQIDYSIFDNEQNEITFVNGLVIEYSIDGVEIVDFVEPREYTYLFKTDDTNYNLINQTGIVEIKMVVIDVVLNQTDYEYTGHEILLSYHFLNEDGDILNDVQNISLQITVDGVVSQFLAVGDYAYQFSTTDINIKLNNATGNIRIVPSVFNITMNVKNYQYNELGNHLDYSILSQNGLDNTNNQLINLTITQGEITKDFLEVGEYQYKFECLDINILLQGDLSGVVNIIPKEVMVTPILDYTYTGEVIAFDYTLSDEIEVKLTLDELRDAKTYPFDIKSLNSNYVIVNGEGIITVEPQELSILDYTSEYVFSNQQIIPSIQISKDIPYTLMSSIGGIEASLYNAGKYNLNVISNDTNYIIVDNVLDIIINPKPIEILVKNNIQEYDKTTKSLDIQIIDNIKYSITYSQNGEIVENVVNAGIYDYQVNVVDTNYVGNVSGQLNITKRDILVQAVPDQYKIYGAQDTTLKYTVDNIISGDDLDIVLQRQNGENAGLYEINWVQKEYPNYNINYLKGYYKIVQKKVFVVAENIQKEYSDIDAPLTYKILSNGMINNDVLSGALVRTPGEDVGDYDILIGTLNNPNYKIIFKKGVYTITKKSLDVTIHDKDVIYGQVLPLTYSIADNYDAKLISGQLSRENGDNVGKYSITIGSIKSDCYSFNIIKNGVYTINPKEIVVEATNTTKVYGDKDNFGYTTDGLLSGDSLNGNLMRENGEDVGQYKILLGTLNNPNYTINFDETYYNINKSLLNITIDDKEQIYGEKEVDFTYSIDGLKFDDKVDLQLFRSNGENVGKYIIFAANIPLKNYVINNIPLGTYTIKKANMIPVLNNESFIYDGKSKNIQDVKFPFKLRYEYKCNGLSVDSIQNAGEYKVQAIFDGNENYNPTKSDIVDVVVQKKNIHFVLGENKYIYDGELKFPEYYFDKNTGLKESSIIFEFVDDVEPIDVGEYHYNINIIDDNYCGEVQGVLTIVPLFSIETENSIVQSQGASFDNVPNKLIFVDNDKKGKLNNQNIVKECKFDNIPENAQHTYTIKVKAKLGADSAYVYKMQNNQIVNEIVANIVDGYYVFDVDDLNYSYVITEDIPPVSMWVWIVMILGIVLVLILAIIKMNLSRKKRTRLIVDVPEGVENNKTNSKKTKAKKSKAEKIKKAK